jgi:hypothetical protein
MFGVLETFTTSRRSVQDFMSLCKSVVVMSSMIIIPPPLGGLVGDQSSHKTFGFVDKSFDFYRTEAKSRPLEPRRDFFRCSPCLRFHGFNASRASYLYAGKAAEGALRRCVCI